MTAPVNAAAFNMASHLTDSQLKIIIAHLKKHLPLEDLHHCIEAFDDWRKAFKDPNLQIQALTVTERANDRLKRGFYWFTWKSNAANDIWIINDFYHFDRILQPELIAAIMPNLQLLTINFVRAPDPRNVINKIGEPNTNLINSISDLTKLQHLEIRKLYENTLRKEITHPTLKYLEITEYEPDTSSEVSARLKIATPELTGFKTNSKLTCFDFSDAPEISQLSVKFFQPEIFTSFKPHRLTHVWCKRLPDREEQTIAAAKQIPDRLAILEELHFRDQIPAELAEFLVEWRERLIRRSASRIFKFFYAGVPIKPFYLLDAFVRPDQEDLVDLVATPRHFEIIVDQYSKLALKLPFTTSVQYNQLDGFRREQPSLRLPLNADFFGQWLNIRDLTVNRDVPRDPQEPQKNRPVPLYIQELLEFMSQCKSLSRLNISLPSEYPVVYHQLPDFFPLLKSLELGQQVPLEFVQRFERLLEINFNYEEALPAISYVVHHTQHLETSRFLNDGRKLKLLRVASDWFSIQMKDAVSQIEMDKQSMINYLATNLLVRFPEFPRQAVQM